MSVDINKYSVSDIIATIKLVINNKDKCMHYENLEENEESEALNKVKLDNVRLASYIYYCMNLFDEEHTTESDENASTAVEPKEIEATDASSLFAKSSFDDCLLGFRLFADKESRKAFDDYIKEKEKLESDKRTLEYLQKKNVEMYTLLDVATNIVDANGIVDEEMMDSDKQKLIDDYIDDMSRALNFEQSAKDILASQRKTELESIKAIRELVDK